MHGVCHSSVLVSLVRGTRRVLATLVGAVKRDQYHSIRAEQAQSISYLLYGCIAKTIRVFVFMRKSTKTLTC